MNGAEPRSSVAVIEDDGLGLLMNRSHRAGGSVDPLLARTIRDFLRDELPREVLDPFAGAAARNRIVTAKLRDIFSRTQNPVLRGHKTDDDSLLALFAAAAGWGPAQRYLDDERINEVKIINQAILVQEAGKPWTVAPETFDSVAMVQQLATNQADLLGVKLDQANPQATIPVAHGTRMHVSIPPCVYDGVLVCIRRGRKRAWKLHDVEAHGTFDAAVGALLQLLIDAQCSLLIAGRTNSGKTGLLEACANSWPHQPHVLSIEDHTLEIGIQHTVLWTRELVESPEAFARVAREALRQTPGLLLPGETRGAEAGAILSMAMSGHSVITTLHAASCHTAVRRFASYAHLGGAYLYEGRYADALRDTSEAFQVVVSMEFWEHLGVRVVNEIALIASPSEQGGHAEPQLITLAELAVADNGTLAWICHARPAADGQLEWHDGDDRTPDAIRTKLRHARARARAQAVQAAPSRDMIADRIRAADGYVRMGQPKRAMAIAHDAWHERPDERLLALALQALAMAPELFVQDVAAATETRRALETALASGAWMEARALAVAAQRELLSAAAAHPEEGWDAVMAQIDAALTRISEAEHAAREAELAIDSGAARRAHQRLQGVDVRSVPTDLALTILQLRQRALVTLVTTGEVAPSALRVNEAELAALEARHGTHGERTLEHTP